MLFSMWKRVRMKGPVNVTQHNGCIELEIFTETIDFFNASIVLKSAMHFIEQAGYPHTIINMKNVADLSSTGVGLLMEIKSLLMHHGSELSIVCTDKSILSVFTITNMKSYFDIRPQMELAVQRFAS
jgi:anti-anti-sigma factor